MDAMLAPTVLQTLWFALIAFFFLGYFVLEGFDFGVQMNVGAFWRRGLTASMIAPSTQSPLPPLAMASARRSSFRAAAAADRAAARCRSGSPR